MSVEIELTESARQRLRELAADGRDVRLSVKAAGCSGYEYVMELVDTGASDDLVIDGDGFSLRIDADSYALALKGLRIDFQRDLLSAAFVYHNPNSKGECGCGASFAV